MASAKREYRMSPFGIAAHPWLNKPDTKYNDSGVFKVDLRLTGEAAQKFMDQIKAQSDRFHAEHTAEMKPVDAKKWTVFYPFEEVEDDDGNKTGEVLFKFRQNHTIRLKSGEEKKVTLRLQNGGGKDSDKAIWGGSELRTMYATRDIVMTSNKEVGVRLDFCGAQVKVYGTGSSGGGFGAVDGWEDDGSEEEAKGVPDAGSDASSASGDY